MILTSVRGANTTLRVVKRLLEFRTGAKVFSQGGLADAIYFIQTGQVEITVMSAHGREAALRVLGPDDFLGEECLVGDSLRTSTAISLEPSTIFRIGKRAMLQALQIQPELSYRFMASLLARGVDLEEHLCSQLSNYNESAWPAKYGPVQL